MPKFNYKLKSIDQLVDLITEGQIQIDDIGEDTVSADIANHSDKPLGIIRPNDIEDETSEAVAKIACIECDEVSTRAEWQKNNGICPKCNKSSQGVAESRVDEGFAGEIYSLMTDLDSMSKRLYRARLGDAALNKKCITLSDNIRSLYIDLENADLGNH